MKRIAFNGGELSPQLALRADLDIYHRGAQTIQNFDISAMGGIQRRKGMRPLVRALADSRLFPYIYSNNQRYLVEIGGTQLRVFSPECALLFNTPVQFGNLNQLRHTQINNLLLITAPDSPPMVLRRSSAGSWLWEPFRFKTPPWRHSGYRDLPVTLEYTAAGQYLLSFDPAESPDESSGCQGELLRASFYTRQQDLFDHAHKLTAGIITLTALNSSSRFEPGQQLAVRIEETRRYYVCTQDWSGSSLFMPGLTSPENYPANFLPAQSGADFAASAPSPPVTVSSLTATMTFRKGDKIALDTGYWQYHTCTAAFNGLLHYRPGATLPQDYPGFFTCGLPVGNAAPCGGSWQFHCSGTWTGQYEVRRSYFGPDLSAEWESAGTSFSRLEASANTQLAGNEQAQPCWLRLFITRSRYEGADPLAGFPPDSCGNRLIVAPYKHHTVLQFHAVEDAQGNPLHHFWQDVSPIPFAEPGVHTVYDWSWQAFGEKYGYPMLAAVFQQRLVLAATRDQPQTLWMSATDDLDNFATGSLDTAALHLTMATATQNGICWLMAQGSRLLVGTSDAEWVLSPGNNPAITHANARIDNHGYVGSAPTPALMAADKIIYVERGGARLYQYGYNYETDSYVSRDLTVFADHILADGGGVQDSCFLCKPHAKAVFTLADGTMALMTYNSHHQVNSWHRYTTQGRVEYCTALPNGTHQDSLYLIVQRADGRFIEVIDAASDYTDHNELDYESLLLTNNLAPIDESPRRTPQAPLMLYLAHACPARGVQITVDGSRWADLDRQNPELCAGWHSLVAHTASRYERIAGLRVHGNRPLHLLAIQA